MQEESYPTSETARFDSAIRSAQRRQLLFWFLGILWLGGVLALSLLFRHLTAKVSQTEAKAHLLANSLQEQQQIAGQLVDALRMQRNDLSLMTRSVKVIQEALINSLPDDRRREFALKLAEAQNEQTLPTQDTPREKTELNATLRTLLRDEGKKESNNSAEGHFLAASSLWADKKHSEAVKEFDAAIAADSRYTRAYIGRARANTELGRYQEAINDCNKAIALEPDNAMAYNNRGFARMKLNEFGAAISDFTAAIARDKTFLNYANRASAYTYAPDYDRAIQDYREAAKIDPSRPWVYIQIARIQWKMGQFAEALKTVDIAIERDPGDSKVYSMRGIIEVALGKQNEAIEDLKRALQLDDSNWEAYGGLGFALDEVGKFAEAIPKLNKAIELSPSAGGYSNRGYAYLNLGDYDAAQKDFLQAISISPDFAPAHAHLGQTYAKTNRSDEALREVSLSIQLNPLYGKAYQYRAQIYAALGEKDKADADEKEAKRVGDVPVRIIVPGK